MLVPKKLSIFYSDFFLSFFSNTFLIIGILYCLSSASALKYYKYKILSYTNRQKKTLHKLSAHGKGMQDQLFHCLIQAKAAEGFNNQKL